MHVHCKNSCQRCPGLFLKILILMIFNQRKNLLSMISLCISFNTEKNMNMCSIQNQQNTIPLSNQPQSSVEMTMITVNPGPVLESVTRIQATCSFTARSHAISVQVGHGVYDRLLHEIGWKWFSDSSTWPTIPTIISTSTPPSTTYGCVGGIQVTFFCKTNVRPTTITTTFIFMYLIFSSRFLYNSNLWQTRWSWNCPSNSVVINSPKRL